MFKPSHIHILCIGLSESLPEVSLATDVKLHWASASAHESTVKLYDVYLHCMKPFNDDEIFKAHAAQLSKKKFHIFVNVESEDNMIDMLPDHLNACYVTAPLTSNKIKYALNQALAFMQQNAYEKSLMNLAKYDVVTGLANRNMFFDFYASAKARANDHNTSIAMVLIDIDNYQMLHTSIGHDAMDEALIAFAERLKVAHHDTDLSSRLGTAKFGVLLPDLEHPTDASRMCERLFKKMEQPLMIRGEEVMLRLNIGIAIYPFDETIDCDLERACEMALLQSVQPNQHNYHYFESHMQSFAEERMAIEKGLVNALANQELEVYYQPKVDAMSGEIKGMEALIRWHSPKWGLVAPNRFIPIAEETGLIDDIGEWVLYESVKQARSWLNQGLFNHKVMSVNVSASQLMKLDFCDKIHEALTTYQFPANQLELELTESSLMQDPELGIAQLVKLRQQGILLAIDDFGTGYSSLNYLRHLPINTLKIDKSFISEIGKKAGSEEIVKVIISLCRIFDLQTVAEGVETNEEIIFLRALQCDMLQGFYFSEPLPREAFQTLLEREPFKLIDDFDEAQPKAPHKRYGL